MNAPHLKRLMVPAVVAVLAICTLLAVGSPRAESVQAPVESLQSEVTQLKARVDELGKVVAGLRKKIARIEKELRRRPTTQPVQPTIEITSPKTGIKVTTYRVLVEGIVRVKNLDGHYLYPVLDPVASDKLYVKPPITAPAPTKDGYSFLTYVPLGTSEQEPSNEHYRIFIIMTKRPLDPGEVTKLPGRPLMSNAVVVQWVSSR